MANTLTTIAFDADDTLWHNERFFKISQDRFAEMLSEFTNPEDLLDRLLAAERRNLGHYGFGIKGFVLSMIETAIEITDDKVPARTIREIIAIGQDMLQHPIELLPHAAETIEFLAPDFDILLITKGDLLDQERKLAQSGLGDLFNGVEIVSDKTAPVYSRIFSARGVAEGAAVMVGNSMKSDVVPAIDAGQWGVHVPHDLTWELEHHEAPAHHPRFLEIPDLGKLAQLVDEIRASDINM